MKEYWFLLQPNVLTYYKDSNGKEVCGSMPLDPSSFVTPINEKDCQKMQNMQRMNLVTGDKVVELAAEDHK